MRLSLLFLTTCAAGALGSLNLRRISFHVLAGVQKRQTTYCTPVENPTCETSCGPGNIPCVYDDDCYNPSAGETCCSDGSYCPAGEYCTDAGCCDVGTSLEECGASSSMSTVAPPATYYSSSPTESASAAAASTTASYSYATTTSTASSTYTATTSSISFSTFEPGSTASSSATETSSSLPEQQTTNAGPKVGGSVLESILSGLGVLLVAL